MSRCYNPDDKSYVDYGGRGIGVCVRWHSVEHFIDDMGHPKRGDTIERIDNSKGYSFSNCEWASRRRQNNNTRRNVTITFDGQTLTRAQWEQKLGIGSTTLRSRLRRGMSLEQAMKSGDLRRS